MFTPYNLVKIETPWSISTAISINNDVFETRADVFFLNIEKVYPVIAPWGHFFNAKGEMLGNISPDKLMWQRDDFYKLML